VYNPTAGQVFFHASQPIDLAGPDAEEKQGTLINPLEEVASKFSLQRYLDIASLANLASVEQSDSSSADSGEWRAKGAPTDIAIEVFAGRFGLNRLDLSQGEKAQWKHVAEYPFDSDVKKMTVIFHHIESNETHIFTKVCPSLCIFKVHSRI
jgi:magnesium-transporting ATPase (P-type)